MTHHSIRTVFAGMPKTGKTSFLAALWQAFDSKEIETSLKITARPSSTKYLNQILADWQGGRPVFHTSLSTEEFVEFSVETAEGHKLHLEFPDMSGEAFEDLWSKGTWYPRLKEFCTNLGGIVLFVHPDQAKIPVRVDQENVVLATAGRPSAPPTNMTHSAVAFAHEKAPLGTQLVHMLQALIGETSVRRLPIAVVISAWDTVETPPTPDEWLQEHVSLLHQFLLAHSDERPYRVFGLSALGGDISNPAEVKRLMRITKASERVLVVEGLETGNDISRPLRWLASARE